MNNIEQNSRFAIYASSLLVHTYHGTMYKGMSYFKSGANHALSRSQF
jgi:hypothetical protein